MRRLWPSLSVLVVFATVPAVACADFAKRVAMVPGVGAYATDGEQVVRLTMDGALPIGRPIPPAGREVDAWAISPLTGTILLQDRHQNRPLRMDGTTGRWQAAGPRDPRGAQVSDPLAAPDAPIWVRAAGSVLLRSTDDGLTWRRWTRLPQLFGARLEASFLAWNPIESGGVLVGTLGGQLYRVDAKARWQRLGLAEASDLTFDWVTGIVADAAKPEQILVSLWAGGIARSVDGGRTFRTSRPSLGGTQEILSLVGAPGKPDQDWATNFDGQHFRSRDAGRSWVSVDRALPPLARGFGAVVAPDGASPGAAYAVAELAPLRAWYAVPGGRWRPLPAVNGG